MPCMRLWGCGVYLPHTAAQGMQNCKDKYAAYEHEEQDDGYDMYELKTKDKPRSGKHDKGHA